MSPRIVKPKSNKESSARGGKNSASKNSKKIDIEARKKEANKNWPWWIPK